MNMFRMAFSSDQNRPPRSATTLLLVGVCVSLVIGAAAPQQSVADEQPDLGPLINLLVEINDDEICLDLLRGMRDGIRGRRNLKPPEQWAAAYSKLSKVANKDVREQVQFLALAFSHKPAIQKLKSTMFDAKAAAELRRESLDLLAQHEIAGLDSDLYRLLDDDLMRAAAIRGLASYSNIETPKRLLSRYPKLTDAERQDTISTLVSRASYAHQLIDAVEAKTVSRSDITAYTARQIESLRDKKLGDRLRQVWGSIRKTNAAKKQLIAKYKKLITDDFLKNANLSHGRLVFSKTCQKCHKLYGEGGKVGPDLTGSNRNNLDYVLENVIDPSAVIPRDYRLSVIATIKGRIINGIVAERTDNSLTVLTENAPVVVSKDDIDEITESKVSMMPDGQFEKLKESQIRDLIAYLRARVQVELPPNNDSPDNKPLKSTD